MKIDDSKTFASEMVKQTKKYLIIYLQQECLINRLSEVVMLFIFGNKREFRRW